MAAGLGAPRYDDSQRPSTCTLSWPFRSNCAVLQNEQVNLDDDSSSASGQLTQQGMQLQLDTLRAQNLALQQELLGMPAPQAVTPPNLVRSNDIPAATATSQDKQPSPQAASADSHQGQAVPSASASSTDPAPAAMPAVSARSGHDQRPTCPETPPVQAEPSAPPAVAEKTDSAVAHDIPAEPDRKQPAAAAATAGGALSPEQIREAIAKRRQEWVSALRCCL